MEFLVKIDIAWPPEKTESEKNRIFEEELVAGQHLARRGQLRRIWRIPGRWANWSLYEVADATQLHAALATLPLFPWMDIEVFPLAEHPNDPRALGIVPVLNAMESEAAE